MSWWHFCRKDRRSQVDFKLVIPVGDPSQVHCVGGYCTVRSRPFALPCITWYFSESHVNLLPSRHILKRVHCRCSQYPYFCNNRQTTTFRVDRAPRRSMPTYRSVATANRGEFETAAVLFLESESMARSRPPIVAT